MSSDFGPMFKAMQLETIDFSQNMLTKYELYDYPVQNGTKNGAVEKAILRIPARTNSWADLSESYLEVEVVLTKADMTDFTDANKTAPMVAAVLTNPWGLFSNIRLDVDTTLVESIDNPASIVNFRNLTSKTRSNLESIAQFEGAYPMISDAGVSNANLVATTGYVKALQYQQPTVANKRNFNNAFTVQLRLSDVIGFCSVKKLLRGGEFILSLTRNEQYNQFLFRATDHVETKCRLHNLTWMIPSLNLQPDAEVSGTMIQSSGQMIPFDYQAAEYVQLTDVVQKQKKSIKSGISNIRRVFLGFRVETQDNNQEHSAYNYVQPIGLNQLALVVDNQRFPARPFKTNNLNQVPLAYHEYMRQEGRNVNDYADAALSYQEWEKSYQIYCFDMSLETPIFGAVSPSQTVFLDIELGTTAYICDILLEHDFHVDVDELGGRLRVSKSG